MGPDRKRTTPDPTPKELGLLELLAIGVVGMIGGGIFSVLGLGVDYQRKLRTTCGVCGQELAMNLGRFLFGGCWGLRWSLDQ